MDLGIEWLGWSLDVWAVIVVGTIVASLVRGFTGFGLALIFMGFAAIVAAPIEVVPIATFLDLAAGIHMAPLVWRQMDHKGLMWLGPGALVAAPIGIAVLVVVPEEQMRLAIAVAILVSTVFIWLGWSLRHRPGPKLLLGTGAMAGFMSGAAGIPGPPIILLYLSAPIPVATARATAVGFFVIVDIVSLFLLSSQGLIDQTALLRTAVLVPIVFGGVAVGHFVFGVARPEAVRQVALALLAGLGATGILKVVLS